MTAWLILIGVALAVVGAIARVALNVREDLREDREAHGGRQTTEAANRATVVFAIVAFLVLIVIVVPLLLSLGDGK